MLSNKYAQNINNMKTEDIIKTETKGYIGDVKRTIGKGAAQDLLTTHVTLADKLLVVDPAYIRYQDKRIPQYDFLFPLRTGRGAQIYSCDAGDLAWICVGVGSDGAYFIENKDICIDSGSFCIFLRHPFDQPSYSLSYHDYAGIRRLYKILDYAKVCV